MSESVVHENAMNNEIHENAMIFWVVVRHEKPMKSLWKTHVAKPYEIAFIFEDWSIHMHLNLRI